MGKLDKFDLRPEEFAFCLGANSPIEASRLGDFFVRLGKMKIPGVDLSDYDIELLELESGCVFGRCRGNFKEIGFGEGEQERIAIEHGNLGKRALPRAKVLQSKIDDTGSQGWTTAARDRILTAVLVMGFVAAITDRRVSRDGDLAAELMDAGGVTFFEFRTVDFHWLIGKEDVPEFSRRMERGPRIIRGGRAAAALNQKNRLAEQGVLRAGDRIGTEHTLRGFPTDELKDERLIERAIAPEIAIAPALAKARRSQLITIVGKVDPDGDVYRFEPAPGETHRDPLVLIWSDEDLSAGRTYEIVGRLYYLPDQLTVFVGSRVRPV